MSSIYCSQSHENPPGSRFCRLCGEKLAVNSQVYPGSVAQGIDTTIGLRYRIKRQLGHGGFGRTYLAEDLNRFNEPCVLKEFAPQVHGTYALQKAEELFEREAGVLYKLQHPQIPRFRELFRADFEKQAHLFLVQDYVEGQTYRQLLDARKLQGMSFTESEVMQLLIQLLPVLQYIHSVGVIHRDISPDNLILRYSDQLPVLIDFGGVKQVAAAVSQYVQGTMQAQPMSAPETRLGKVGYAPEEQMQLGRAYPHSDLYALATTVLVLLTGKEPQEFLGSLPRRNWGQELNLSPGLSAILEQMRSPRPNDRYQSAAEVLQALGITPVDLGYVQTQPPPSYIPPAPPNSEIQGTVAIAPPVTPHSPTPYAPTPHTPSRQGFGFGKLLVVLALISGSAGAGWWATTNWILPEQVPGPPTEEAVEPGSDESPRFSEAEQARKAELQTQREELGIPYEFYVNLANAAFYERYPDQRGRTLTDGPEDEEWRSHWDEIAAEWLDTLETSLSPEARGQLGSYDEGDREQWKQQANQLYVGSRSLYDLADAQFFHLFPEQRGKDFLDQPLGQVWQGIVFDRLRTLQDGSMLEQIKFDADSYSEQLEESLEPGEGRVYTANLSEGQILRLDLDAPSDATQLSVYLPRPTSNLPVLLEDSTDTRWSSKLPQSGFYEVVVVSTASEPIDYQLDLTVDNVTSSPVEPEEPEAPEAKN
ncbi:protein kinase [Oculatella sp. FACHB-28]|uniref:serine/threonine-protein kinase n=1 Tax=Oculatella sp. FACHB-28 TaxID=2692845 RepID=UPI0016850A9A|nr:serine/threonine-protein kinase [Oculatella sp. FACHB-28]MBD2055220.1 protein kinase [Oculatella sp. FACHB-28]